MPIERTTRTPLIRPVSAIAGTSPQGNDTREQSERMRPVHIAVAQEAGIAGAQRLAAMAQGPVPPHIAAALRRYEQDKRGQGLAVAFGRPAADSVAGETRATISPEGQSMYEGEKNGSLVITEAGPEPEATRLYAAISAITLR